MDPRCDIPLPGGWRLTELPPLPLSLSVDDALLTLGLQAERVRMPLQELPAADARTAAGALMLGAACVLTGDLLSPDAADALARFAVTLRFHPDNFRKSRPALGTTALGDVPGIIVRDGNGQRAYFAATPAQLLPLCPLVWDTQPRPLLPEEASALPDSGAWIAFATAEVHGGVMEPAVYLGSVALAPAPNRPITDAIARLQQRGISVFPWHAEDAPPPGTLCVTPDPTDGAALLPPAPDAPGLEDAVHAVLDAMQTHQLHLQRCKRKRLLSRAAAALVMAAALGFLWLVGVAHPFVAGTQMFLTCILVLHSGHCIRSRTLRKRLPVLLLLLLGVGAAFLRLDASAAAFALVAGLLSGAVLCCGHCS